MSKRLKESFVTIQRLEHAQNEIVVLRGTVRDGQMVDMVLHSMAFRNVVFVTEPACPQLFMSFEHSTLGLEIDWE